MGLVDEAQYMDLFGRYVEHVSHWVKHEKIRNKTTGQYADPDEDLMKELEKNLEVGNKPEEFRKGLISAIAAWAIDHPGRLPDYAKLFERLLNKLKESYFADRRKIVGQICKDALRVLADGAEGLAPEPLKSAQATLARAKERFGYCDGCLRETLAMLLKQRFRE